MKACPLCGLEFEDTDLVRHYLNERELVEFIQETYLNWKPEDGACSRCLEANYRELRSKDLTRKLGDEQTVITHTNQFAGDEERKEIGACLITIHGTDLGKKYDLWGTETIIGRGEDAAVRILGENVSRQHARINKIGGEFILEDLQSTNGTFVNTRKVASQPLRDGDLVLIGNTILKFMSGTNVEHQYHEEIYKLATLDGLTKLYNKNFFIERLQDEFGRSQRYGRDLALILFDFDHFKSINDTYGHLAGDEILKTSAELIIRNMRKEDVCGRYGGEEFGVLLPEIPPANALYLAEKIRKLVEVKSFRFNNTDIRATISVGVASLSKDIPDYKTLVQKADQALYRAKNDGRNCVRS